MRNKLFLLISASLVSTSLYAMDCNFDNTDTNRDGKITKDEFHNSVSDSGKYWNYDTNKDGSLDEDEFRETNLNEAWYNDWDVNNDNLLDENEFSDGLFTSFDDNEDGHWDGNEWDDAGDEGLWDI